MCVWVRGRGRGCGFVSVCVCRASSSRAVLATMLDSFVDLMSQVCISVYSCVGGRVGVCVWVCGCVGVGVGVGV